MKIISRKQLMEMPVGTIFSYYEPCFFQGLHSLGGSSEYDFTVQSIVANIKADNTGDYIENCTRMEKGESVGLDFDSYGREGLFEDKQPKVNKDLAGLVVYLRMLGGGLSK